MRIFVLTAYEYDFLMIIGISYMLVTNDNIKITLIDYIIYNTIKKEVKFS